MNQFLFFKKIVSQGTDYKSVYLDLSFWTNGVTNFETIDFHFFS